MERLLGNQLTPEDQKHALAAYVHRFTADHKPAWASQPWKDGKSYPVQFASDAEWLANTTFSVRADGRLDRSSYSCCFSHPTWPDNPELRRA